ncbi:MAG: EAL domain-containing protein [Burkholderiales bacterium]|nr:EAL domain-containing protein [Burkholderiales bacterium]
MTIHAPFKLDALLALMTEESGKFAAHHREFVLYSHFQPIYSFAHRRVVGHEGLMRAWGPMGKALSPYTVFASARSEQELISLDRLSRLLHARNFAAAPKREDGPPQWLFLNAEPNAFAQAGESGRFFPEMLATIGLRPEQVVVEVLETAIDNNRQLARAVEYFREIGCLIAIDDFGAGHSNVDRIWRLKPDIVKLDRTLIADASDNREARQILPGLVNLLHEAGALVLAEGVETKEEAVLALEADCDLVQGYYFAVPGPELSSTEPQHPLFESLWTEFSAAMQREIEHNQRQLTQYTASMMKCAARMAEGESLIGAAEEFMNLPAAIRCFLLDSGGRQVGDNLIDKLPTSNSFPRFAPLDNVSGAVWSRRHYFRQAMKRYGELQISRPYLSIAGEEQCVTLSIGVTLDGTPHVLCGDLYWLGQSEFDAQNQSVV